MKSLNVSKVYYSTNEGSIICEKVKNMISIQASTVTKHIYKLNNKNKLFSDSEYFEKLLINNFPIKIKEHSLICFLKYNLINVLPYHKYYIKKNIFSINCSNIVITSLIC